MAACLVVMESLALPRLLLLNLASLKASIGEQLVIHHRDLRKLSDYLVAAVHEGKSDSRTFNNWLLECKSWAYVVQWDGQTDDIVYNIDIVAMILGFFDIDLSDAQWNAVKSWLHDFNSSFMCKNEQTITNIEAEADHNSDYVDTDVMTIQSPADEIVDVDVDQADRVDPIQELLLRQQRQIRMLKNTIRRKNQTIRRMSAKLKKQCKLTSAMQRQKTSMDIERIGDTKKHRRTTTDVESRYF